MHKIMEKKTKIKMNEFKSHQSLMGINREYVNQFSNAKLSMCRNAKVIPLI